MRQGELWRGDGCGRVNCGEVTGVAERTVSRVVASDGQVRPRSKRRRRRCSECARACCRGVSVSSRASGAKFGP